MGKENRAMRKKMIFLVLFLGCFLFGACGEKSETEIAGFQKLNLQEIKRAKVSQYTVPNHTDTVEMSREDIKKVVDILKNAQVSEIGSEEHTAVAGGTPVFEIEQKDGKKETFFGFQEWIGYEGKSYKVGSEVCRKLDEISYGLLPESDVFYD